MKNDIASSENYKAMNRLISDKEYDALTAIICYRFYQRKVRV
jgi:hypothetical protein